MLILALCRSKISCGASVILALKNCALNLNTKLQAPFPRNLEQGTCIRTHICDPYWCVLCAGKRVYIFNPALIWQNWVCHPPQPLLSLVLNLFYQVISSFGDGRVHCQHFVNEKDPTTLWKSGLHPFVMIARSLVNAQGVPRFDAFVILPHTPLILLEWGVWAHVPTYPDVTFKSQGSQPAVYDCLLSTNNKKVIFLKLFTPSLKPSSKCVTKNINRK